jgi:phosphoesterase RecJ-like protein
LSKYTKELSIQFERSDNILIVAHINPDGDAIGSQLALYHYLRSLNKTVNLLSPNNLQDFLKWMEGAENIQVFIRNRKKSIEMIRNADLIVMVDFNQMNRLGEAEEEVNKSSARKIVIDHHLDPVGNYDLIISDPARCATAELVYGLITELNGRPFGGRAFSECIYVGIVTDTGNFEHGNYTPDTFRIVATLLESGLQKEKILNLIYNNFSAARMRLLGYALNQRMVVMHEKRTAYIWLTREDLDNYDHSKGDTEGFVNMPLSISGVVFSALFIEKEGFVKISFRSKGTFPVNEFASKYFGGGGHLNASGAEKKDSLENTINYFLEALAENDQKLAESLR